MQVAVAQGFSFETNSWILRSLGGLRLQQLPETVFVQVEAAFLLRVDRYLGALRRRLAFEHHLTRDDFSS